MRFRPYVPADRDACLALFDSNVPAYFAPSERDDYAAFLDGDGVPYFLLVEGERALACGGVAISADGEARMCWGIVDGARHRERLGTRLLLERLVAGADLGASRAGLDTIPKTVPFFARFGFRVVREVPDGYGPGIHRRDLSLDLDASTTARLRALLAAEPAFEGEGVAALVAAS